MQNEFYSGKIARSKPVIRRITSTKVQSIYKHIYVLDGTVVDDRMGKRIGAFNPIKCIENLHVDLLGFVHFI